jgi:polyhydroxybutyrate depolymerase
VISLHGYADNPRLSELYTGWSGLADKEKFIVVYPYGTRSKQDPALSWNAGSCCGTALEKNIDDVEFIEKVIDQVKNDYKINEKKIFLSGFSNGGLMTYRFAAAKSEIIRSAAVVAGAIGGRKNNVVDWYMTPTPKGPVNVVMFHGKEDWLVPYLGGKSNAKSQSGVPEFTAFEKAVDFWRVSNGCKDHSQENNEFYLHDKYFDCINDTKVDSWTISSRNHEWTGGVLELLLHGSITGPKTTNEIWKFFVSVSPNL